MPNRRKLYNRRRVAIVREARAGLIPEPDDMIYGKQARMYRAVRVEDTVKGYARAMTCGLQGLAITNILADLRQYCDCHSLDFRRLDVAASALYLDESDRGK
jgi:hypothetical protein